MSRNLELERQHTPLVNSGQNESKIPHGVSPQTHGFLIAAQVYNAFANIDPITRNSIAIYYGTEVSLKELPNYIGAKCHRTTSRNRILKGLDRAWEQLPLQVQSQFHKEQVIKLKNFHVSPRYVARIREASVTLWQDESYRQKTMEGIQRRDRDPNFIQGKNHTPEIIKKIKSSLQKHWNERHGIPTNDPLAKRTELVTEWQLLSLLLGHSPSFKEIAKLKKEGRTKFSENMYRKEFGQGSCKNAREVLTAITEAPEVLPAIAKKESHIKIQIGKDERSTWEYAKDHGLLPIILKLGMITKPELVLVGNYFEHMRIGQNLTMKIFTKFTKAVANVA